MSSNLLFYGKRLSDLIRGYEAELSKEIESWERNKILATSEHDLIAYLVQKYTLDAPHILRDQIYVENEGEVKIDVSNRFEYGFWDQDVPHYVSGSYVTVAIPFEGDADLFEYQASTFSFNPPRGRISGSKILISFQDVKLDPEKTRQRIDTTVTQVEEYLGWINSDCGGWNARIQDIAEQRVRERKQRLLEQADMVNALGLPIRRRADASETFSVLVARKKRPIELPPTPKEAFKPEPMLPDEEYSFILSVIEHLSQSIERSPSTFIDMEEEQIRDLILVSLNGHYEGDATGETFNAQGKTDILIRANGRNVFIAECKFWKGPSAMHSAIDQILNYLTWRDTKAALLIFSKNVDFTNVLSGIAANIPKHQNFKRELQKISDTHVRYLFRQDNDPNRDLYLAVLVFDIPKREKNQASSQR